MHPNDIVGKKRLERIEGVNRQKHIRRLVWELSQTMSAATIRRVAWNLVYFWDPSVQGTKVPSVILAVALASRTSIEAIAAFAASDTFTYAKSAEASSFFHQSERVWKRAWALGLELDGCANARVCDYGRHLMVDASRTPSDWVALINHLLSELGDLRKNVVEHLIEAASQDTAADLAMALADVSFGHIDLQAAEHSGPQVARLHWVIQALRKSKNHDAVETVLELFAKLKTIPGPIRNELHNLVRALVIVPPSWLESKAYHPVQLRPAAAAAIKVSNTNEPGWPFAAIVRIV